MNKNIFILSIFILLVACNSEPEKSTMSESNWKLGWRMIENSWDENYTLAESQFDSLLNSKETLNERFILTGLEIKANQSKEKEVLRIMANQPPVVISKICQQDFAAEYTICKTQPKEEIENRDLQLKIIDLFVDDQAIRGNIMHDVIKKYNIDTTGLKTHHDWSNPEEVNQDEIIRDALKPLLEEYGFPTKDLIGRDALRGVFFIIQHADGDKEWQKAQLPKLEIVVNHGDLSKQKYAYLFDRIKVNEGKPQRYGSQFETVDKESGIAKLHETEDIESLNTRRREMDMMPIELYKRLILKY